jgi:hypothetical protein
LFRSDRHRESNPERSVKGVVKCGKEEKRQGRNDQIYQIAIEAFRDGKGVRQKSNLITIIAEH